MDVLLLSPTPDQSISPYKQNRNHRRIINNNNYPSMSSHPNENFSGFHQNIINGGGGRRGGVLTLPHPPSQPSFQSSCRRPPQPPLLPLPISKPYSSLNNLCSQNLNNRGRGGRALSSSPPTNKKNFIPRKPKSSISPKKHESIMKSMMGPEPGNLPKEVSKVMRSTSSLTAAMEEEEQKKEASFVQEEVCGSSIFLLAPPPSSLPLPKFSLKPKKSSCNVEAAVTITTGINAGATNDLRKLLRL